MLGRTLVSTLAPASLRKKRLAGLSTSLALFAVLVTATPVLGWSSSTFSAADEQLLFSLTNQDRAAAGLNALVNDTYLHKEAEWRAHDMGDRNYFSHQIPPGNEMVFTHMQSDGYCFKVAGENIGLSTYGDDIATSRIEAAFMGSPSHRDNILGTWARMGVGAYKAPDGRKLYTVLFSIPCGTTAPKATPVKTAAPARTARPTAKPTARPAATATPTPTPTAKETIVPTDTPEPTGVPTPKPTTATAATTPRSTSATTPVPNPALGPDAVDHVGTLRVREKSVSQGPVDSIFHWLFGGLFGW
jgi:uncharacterized protein YkwD